MKGVLFVLGSHVRHLGVMVWTGIYSIEWVPFCGQRRPRNDGNGVPWRVAATPAQNSREVCTRCIREAARIARAVL